MDIELMIDPYACMMYIVSPLAGLGPGAYIGGLPPTACLCSETRKFMALFSYSDYNKSDMHNCFNCTFRF